MAKVSSSPVNDISVVSIFRTRILSVMVSLPHSVKTSFPSMTLLFTVLQFIDTLVIFGISARRCKSLPCPGRISCLFCIAFSTFSEESLITRHTIICSV